MCVCSILLQLKIPCVWLFGLNHWLESGVKPNKYRLKRKEKNESREEIFYQMKEVFFC